MKYLLSSLLFISCLLSYYSSNGQIIFPVKQGQKWGLIDEKGKVFLPPTYDAVSKIDQFGYSIIQTGQNIGLIDKSGKVVFQPQFQDIRVLEAELFGVKRNEVWTIINKQQKTILKEKYSEIEQLEDGAFLRFLWQGKYGIVTRNGKLISTAQYESIEPSTVGTFFIQKNGKKGIINMDGQIVLPAKFDKVIYNEQNYIFVYNENKWGIYTEQAEEIQSTKWNKLSKLTDNLIRLKGDKTVSLLNLSTRQIISEDKYDNFLPYANNDAIVVRKGIRIGLINLNGDEILSCRYKEILPFTDGLYRVKNGGKWGIVAQNDDLILPTEYNFIAPLKGSVCGVKKRDLFGIVNIKGEIVLPFRYTRISIEDNQAKAYQGGSLTMYNYDDDGVLQNEHNYKKVGSIKVGRNMRRRRITRTQQSLQIGNFEWYNDPMQDRWGLRNIETGEDQIPPTYDMISIQRNLGFTIVGMESMGKIEIDRTEFRFDHNYGIVNNERGLQVSEINMWDIRLDDFNDKNLPTARVVFNDGRHGLMAKNGKILQKGFLYVGEFEDGLARISMKGNWSLTMKKTDNNITRLLPYLNNLRVPSGLASVTNYDQMLYRNGFLYSKNALWGYMDTLGKIVIQPQFDFAREFDNQVAVVQLDGNWGLINLKGTLILDCKYNDVQYLENADKQMVRVLVKKERVGMIDSLGNVIVPAIYNKIGKVHEGRVAVKRGAKWGFCDMKGNEVVKCQYDKVQDFSEGLAAFKQKRRWGFMDKNGNVIIKNEYKRAGNFKNDLAPIVLNYDYQYIDKSGKIVIKTPFKMAHDFENGVARVKDKQYWGLIDVNGQFVYKPAKYSKILPFDANGLAVVQTGNNNRYYAVINQKGEKLTSKKYSKIEAFSSGLARVKGNNGYGFIDTNGEEVIKTNYLDVTAFSENIAAVKINGKWGYINTSGDYILEPIYSKALPFKDGFGVVYHTYKASGLVNLTGEFSIKPDVNRILAFSEGKGLMRTPDYKYSFITENNKLAKGYFQDALPYQNNIAIVKRNNRWGLLTHQGVEIVPPKYDEIEPFENGFAQIKIKSFHGVMDLSGKVIVEPNYEYITYWGNGIFRVENGDKMGYFNIDGDWIWAME